jgi:septum formation protein
VADPAVPDPTDPNLSQLSGVSADNCNKFAGAAGPPSNLSQLFATSGNNCNTFAGGLVLASASPRRRDLLTGLGLRFEVRVAAVDESPRPGEPPGVLVERLAGAKAEAAAAVGGTDEVVIAADTVVVVDGDTLGKPVDAGDAARMLRHLGGRTHRVVTGVAVRRDGAAATTVVSTDVTFTPLTEADIAWYVTTGEPLDKAGAYAIQGAGGLFVERIAGSYHNVVGLPLAQLESMCARMDIDLRSFAR